MSDDLGIILGAKIHVFNIFEHFSLVGSRLLISSSILLRDPTNIPSSTMLCSHLFIIIQINIDLFHRSPYRNPAAVCSTRVKHGRSVDHVRHWSLVSGIGLVWSRITRWPEETGRDGYGIWAGSWRVLAIRLDRMWLTVFEGGGLGKKWKMSRRIWRGWAWSDSPPIPT